MFPIVYPSAPLRERSFNFFHLCVLILVPSSIDPIDDTRHSVPLAPFSSALIFPQVVEYVLYYQNLDSQIHSVYRPCHHALFRDLPLVPTFVRTNTKINIIHWQRQNAKRNRHNQG
jgi:hypothetical protein